VFEKEESLADKLGLPSSLSVQNISDTADRVVLRVKEDFDLDGEAFASFLEKAYSAFSK
jgi:hypothetical protein